MKILLTIGHTDILLPDDSGIPTILKVLSKGVLVYERLYKGEVELQKESTIKLEMKVVPEGTHYTMGDKPIDEPMVRPMRPVRQHPTTAGQRQLGYSRS